MIFKPKPILYFLFLLLLANTVRSQSYFPVDTPPDPDKLAANIAHTMQQLSQAKPNDPGEVRILIYGQSISVQDWWKEVKQFMEKQYPQARINMINLAVGGFSTDRLKLIVENDVRSFYLDLILLHNYGNAEDYERILQTIRRHTTAEVAIQTDHISIGQNEEWHGRHNNTVLPAFARKYGLAVIDVRAVWKQYLEKNQLSASALLTDNVHLNEHGNYLMAEIIKNYFKHVATIPAGKPARPRYSSLQAGKDFSVKNNTLTVPLTGNRVDLVWNTNAGTSEPVTLLLDSKKPSAYTESYYYTRPVVGGSESFLGKMGKLLALKLGKGVSEEDWTLTVTAIDTVKMQLQFSLRGSVTGEDGTGSSDNRFVSRSGKIIIEPDQWFRRKSPGDFKMFGWIQPGDTLQWQVKLMSHDRAEPKPSTVNTVVQGITNSQHELMLKGKNLIHLKEIRVYQPPLQK